MITKSFFGNTKNGEEVFSFILDNNKIKAEILTFGGTIRSLFVPSNNGVLDVVLGYDTVKEYEENDGYLGATIGRNANRIKDAKFTLNNKEYVLNINDHNCCNLHGGNIGFSHKVFEVISVDAKTCSLTLKVTASDGEEFYPGNVSLFVTYTLKDYDIILNYKGLTDAPTPFNITNHSYFNLDGEGTLTAHDAFLKIPSNFFLPTDESLVPTGEILSVINKPYDFNEYKQIKKDINADDKAIKIMQGYDLNYCLSNYDGSLKECASVYSQNSKVKMSVLTTERGVQLYTGAYVTKRNGKNNHVYVENTSFCLETQNYPDTYNNPQFGNSILNKGEEYLSTTIYSFSMVK